MKITFIKEGLRFALQALRANLLRTLLSLLGVTIGVFAIVFVMTLVSSLEKGIQGSIESLGDNVIFVQKWPWTFGQNYPWWKYINRPVVQPDELEYINRKSKMAQATCYMASARANATYRGNAFEDVDLVAASHDYDRVKELKLAAGRYFTYSESKSGKPLCIIGVDVAGVLYGNPNAVGKTIEVNKRSMQVIGVLEREGESFLGNSSDQQIFVPLNYARSFLDIRSEQTNPMILVKAKPKVANQELIDELTGIMRAVRRQKPKQDDNFALNQTSMLTNTFSSVFDVINIAGIIIGLFSVLVGGFSIANIMFVSVKERTNIIGIQKALGARQSFILFQFLTESVVLCLLGGTIGILIVGGLALLMNAFADFSLVLTLGNLVFGVSVSVGIGLVSGILPALAAARMDPVEAIRSN
ncbi:ABC transporter permease [bacterium SCSIO 12741]|nr:ABC transporter permease [bacterium SCSIO 12741]